jgi:hypothetical protein
MYIRGLFCYRLCGDLCAFMNKCVIICMETLEYMYVVDYSMELTTTGAGKFITSTILHFII